MTPHNWPNFLRCHGQAGSICLCRDCSDGAGLPCATHRRGGAVGGRHSSAQPGLAAGLASDDAVHRASLIAAINSVVGGIGLAAADCPGSGAWRPALPPGRYHRRRGSVRALPAVSAPARHQPRTADEQSRRDLVGLGDLQDAATCSSRSWPAAVGRSPGTNPSAPCPGVAALSCRR